MSNCWEGWPAQSEAEREAAWELPTDDAWRGARHFEPWPEYLAGPEYHLFKRGGHQPPDTPPRR